MLQLNLLKKYKSEMQRWNKEKIYRENINLIIRKIKNEKVKSSLSKLENKLKKLKYREIKNV